jgi:hypothetical protein
MIHTYIYIYIEREREREREREIIYIYVSLDPHTKNPCSAPVNIHLRAETKVLLVPKNNNFFFSLKTRGKSCQYYRLLGRYFG